MATAAPGARRSQAIPTTTSIVDDHGSYASSCGYCDRKGRTSKSHGMHAHVCSVEDYQSLLDRGWRRSGCWMYRPHLNDTCCPLFTIRLDACAFAPSKSQRKVEKRWRRYLDGELDDDGKRVDDGDKDESRGRERLGADASGVSASASLADRDAEVTHAETRDADATRTNETTATKKTKRAFEFARRLGVRRGGVPAVAPVPSLRARRRRRLAERSLLPTLPGGHAPAAHERAHPRARG